MEKFLQLLVAGISVGGIYALIALGFVAVYKVSGTFNFAQGGFVLLGAFVTYQYGDEWGMPFFLALLLAMLTLAGIAMAAERLVIRPMIGKPPFTMLLITIGLLGVYRIGFHIFLPGVNIEVLEEIQKGKPAGV